MSIVAWWWNAWYMYYEYSCPNRWEKYIHVYIYIYISISVYPYLFDGDLQNSIYFNITILVGGFKHEFYFPFHIWDVILPIDELPFFKMVFAPPTRIR